MLLIRLYKDVILNNSYQNVFSLGKFNNKSVLEHYLETKEFYDIECANAYYENKGEFVIDYELIKENIENNIYEYNYMKVLETNETKTEERLMRYCFINDINIKNGCVYIYYDEDIWSSYSDKIKGTTECMLSRSRIKDFPNLSNFTELRSLPIDYDGNNNLEIVRFEQPENLKDKVHIILELQAYDIVSAQQGNTPRLISQFLYRDIELQNGQYVGGNSAFTFEEAQSRILKLLTFQADYFADCTYWNAEFAGVHKFEIGNVYILPADYIILLQSIGNPTQTGTFYQNSMVRIKQTDNMQLFDFVAFLQCISRNINGFVMKTLSIENNYKNLMVGTLSTPIKLENNGTNIEIEIKMFCSISNFGIYLNINNQIIDITNDFAYEFPFEPISSVELAQRRISNQLKNLNINYAKQMNGLNLGQSIVGGLFSSMKNVTKGITKFAFGNPSGVSDIASAGSDISGIGFGIAKSIATKKKLNEEQTLINSPMYSNSKGIFGNTLTFINNIYGIVLLRINSDNDDYVKSMINNFGFKVYKFINTELLEDMDLNGYTWYNSQNINYNTVKFESPNVYGSFPKAIADILNEILSTGVKIWYNYQMTEDNYV